MPLIDQPITPLLVEMIDPPSDGIGVTLQNVSHFSGRRALTTEEHRVGATTVRWKRMRLMEWVQLPELFCIGICEFNDRSCHDWDPRVRNKRGSRER